MTLSSIVRTIKIYNACAYQSVKENVENINKNLINLCNYFYNIDIT